VDAVLEQWLEKTLGNRELLLNMQPKHFSGLPEVFVQWL